MVRRIQALLAVTDRQRHVHAGQAQGLHLGHGSRTRTAHDEIRNGQRVLHRGQVINDVPTVRQTRCLDGGAHGLILAPARQVHDLGTLRKSIGGPGHRLIDVQCTQGTTRDEQRRHIGVHAQTLGSLPARLRRPLRVFAAARQICDCCTQRQARHDRLAATRTQRGRWEGEGDDRRIARSHLVGQARASILLVDDDRDTRALGRDVRGRRHVASETNEDVGPFQGTRATLHGVRETRRQGEESEGRTARQRHARNLHQWEAGSRNQIRLQTSLCPQHDHLGAALTQLRGRRQKRIHVAGGPAASHHNLDHKRLLYACVAPV